MARERIFPLILAGGAGCPQVRFMAPKDHKPDQRIPLRLGLEPDYIICVTHPMFLVNSLA